MKTVFTIEHTRKLAELLEDMGWTVFEDPALACPICAKEAKGTHCFCPHCGADFSVNPPEADNTEMEVLEQLHGAVLEAMEDA